MRTIVLLTVMASALPAHLSSLDAMAQETISATPRPRISGTVCIGDRSLNIDCPGAGSPTVILDAGQDGGGSSMTALQRVLADEELTCFYDRAGQGLSDPPPTWPRSAGDAVMQAVARLYNDPEARAMISQVIAAARDPHVWSTPLAETPTA
jgi:hypothetical protein